jgi:hypothetical protein
MALPDWLNSFPEWLSRLAADPALAELGIVWLSEEQGRARAQGLVDLYADEGSAIIPLPAPMLAAARKMVTGKVVIATGPTMSMRVSDEVTESLLILDQSRPDEVLVALSRDYAPFLWITAGTTVASIRAALSGYFFGENPPRARLHRIARYFVGNERMLDTDIHGIENHYIASPFTAELSWGSAALDDPWPARLTSHATFINDVLRNSKQDDDGIYSTSFRLQHSRAILTIEDHVGLFVIEIRYQPSNHREVIAGVNRRFDLAFPADMPVDGVAALLGLSLQSEATLRETLADHELAEDHDLVLHALAALKSGDLTVGQDFNPFLRPHTKVVTQPGSLRAATIPPPPSVRSAALMLMQRLDMDFVVLKHSAANGGSDAFDHLGSALEQGRPEGWDGQNGPHLLIAGDEVERPSLDWIWGAQGWELTREAARGPKRLFHRQWRTRDGRATIMYVEDHRLGLRFFNVEGEDRDATIAQLRGAVAIKETESVLAAAESATDPAARVGAILKIARLAPNAADARWTAMLQAGLAHENAAVRAASALAGAYIGWPELIPVLEQHAGESGAHADQAIAWIRHAQRAG